MEYGIAEGQEQPSNLQVHQLSSEIEDDLVDPQPIGAPAEDVTSYTGPMSTISDEDLDELLLRLRRHFRRAGITMIDGMLRRLGHRVTRERIRYSLQRIDPVQRVFQRITIRRRVYSVAGPNAL